MVAQGVSENMRMVGKGAAGRERKREKERNGGGRKAVIRVLGGSMGVAVHAVALSEAGVGSVSQNIEGSKPPL